jgi:hypothetical protein
MRRDKLRKRTAHLSTGQEQAFAILHDEVFMQLWFIPKPIYLAIRRLLPNIHLMKMRHYFDDYRCLRCGDSDAVYGASGFCHSCNVIVRSRVSRWTKKAAEEGSRQVGTDGERSLFRSNEPCTAYPLRPHSYRRNRAQDKVFDLSPKNESEGTGSGAQALKLPATDSSAR